MYFPMQEAIMNTVFLIYSAYQEDGVFMMIKNQMDFHLLVKGMPSCYDIDISWERSGRHGEIRHSGWYFRF